MKKITTVIFDFDGTIADTNKLIMDSWQAVFRARTGADGDPEQILSTFGEPLYYTMEKFFPDYDVEESVKIYRDYQKDIFEEAIEVFPGVIPLIKKLKAKGYKTGLVTSRLKDPTYQGLRIFGIEGDLDEVVTVEDTDKHKPSPEPALICLERLGSQAEESIMVGDSLFDVGCAQNAGMKAVMVGWSAAADAGKDNQEVGIYIPDYTIDKADDLWGILEIDD